jgi:hypothetical protein
MKILYINNHGGGFADQIEVEDGSTVQKLFEQKMPGADPADYLIRVDRLPASAEQVLSADSRVSVTPLKIEGA